MAWSATAGAGDDAHLGSQTSSQSDLPWRDGVTRSAAAGAGDNAHLGSQTVKQSGSQSEIRNGSG